jgi:hypothetical protein
MIRPPSGMLSTHAPQPAIVPTWFFVAGWVNLGMHEVVLCVALRVQLAGLMDDQLSEPRGSRIRSGRCFRAPILVEPPSTGHLPHESLEVWIEFLPAGRHHFIE